MKVFKSLPSFAARVRYCNEKLQRISSGSARIVYKIDDEKVLKLAFFMILHQVFVQILKFVIFLPYFLLYYGKLNNVLNTSN